MVQLSPSLLHLQDRDPTIITVHSSRRHGDPISSLVPFSYLSLHPLTYSAYVVLLPSTYLLPHQQHHQPISHHPLLSSFIDTFKGGVMDDARRLSSFIDTFKGGVMDDARRLEAVTQLLRLPDDIRNPTTRDMSAVL